MAYEVEIREVAPEVPASICGWCSGADLAIEGGRFYSECPAAFHRNRHLHYLSAVKALFWVALVLFIIWALGFLIGRGRGKRWYW